MYKFNIPDKVKDSLKEASRISQSIEGKLNSLSENPMAIAIPTENELLGDYYINAGRYCILFSIDDEAETVNILSVRQKTFVYNVLVGRIKP